MSAGRQTPSPKLTFTKPYLMKTLLFAFIAIQAFMSTAQQTNYMPLDHNNVSCLLDDEGGFFNNLPSGLAGYEIPKQSGLSTIFAGSYWMGAQDVNGALYMSAINDVYCRYVLYWSISKSIEIYREIDIYFCF